MQTIKMLAAHHPSLDPRIDWEAESASKNYLVQVVGFNDIISNANSSAKKSYETILLEKHILPGIYPLLLDTLRLIKHSTRMVILYLSAITVLIFTLPPLYICQQMLFSTKKIIKRTTLLRNILKYCLNHKISKIIIKRIHPVYVTATLYYGTFLHFMTTGSVFWKNLRNSPRVDIIHCNDLDTLLAGVLAKHIFKSSIVYDAHEFWPYSNVETPKHLVNLLKKYENFLIQYADNVITVNHLLADIMRQEYKLDRIDAIPNCEPWQPLPQTPLKPTPPLKDSTHGAIKFLYQGNFYKGRGIELLLNTWKELNPPQAILCIRGLHNKYYEECLCLAEKTGLLNKNLFFIDAVSEDNLVCAASYFDVGIIPYEPVTINNKYACPNKLSQYLHAGLAILANNLDFVSEIISQNKVGITYDSHIPHTLKDALTFYINNPEQLKIYKENALSTAKNTFNWQAYEKVLLSAYCKL